MLFYKRIQQKYLNVDLRKEEDLKILRLFVRKKELNIVHLRIRGKFMMKKEDFELIKP
jgi:hypothetical protein